MMKLFQMSPSKHKKKIKSKLHQERALIINDKIKMATGKMSQVPTTKIWLYEFELLRFVNNCVLWLWEFYMSKIHAQVCIIYFY